MTKEPGQKESGAPQRWRVPKNYSCDFHFGVEVIEYSAYRELEEKLRVAERDKAIRQLDIQSIQVQQMENEIDELRERVKELEAQLKMLNNPSDGRCMEIGALRQRDKDLTARLRRAISIIKLCKLEMNEEIFNLIESFLADIEKGEGCD